MNKDDLLDDDDELDFNQPSLNIELVQQNIPDYSSEKLCEMIVCHRYFGCYAEVAVMCMEELSKRRIAGDNYDFENYIDQAYNDLPKLDFKIPEIGEALRQIINSKSFKK